MPNNDDSLIPYRDMMKRALHGLVREALDLVGTDGLPGNHHFYISFRTRIDGVEMPAHLRARYPEEMTIVLQHQFRGLETDEAGFSVTLSFGGRSERLTIPFEALTAFTDPAVNFGLQFRRQDGDTDTPDGAGAEAKTDADADTGKGDDSGTVVTLDTFRKK